MAIVGCTVASLWAVILIFLSHFHTSLAARLGGGSAAMSGITFSNTSDLMQGDIPSASSLTAWDVPHTLSMEVADDETAENDTSHNNQTKPLEDYPSSASEISSAESSLQLPANDIPLPRSTSFESPIPKAQSSVPSFKPYSRESGIRSAPILQSNRPMAPVSLPPGDLTVPDIIRDMLPSTMNVVEHDPNEDQVDPNKRPLCSEIIKSIGNTSSNDRNTSSRAFTSIRAIVHLLKFSPSVHDAFTDKSKIDRAITASKIDKAITASLGVLKSSGGSAAHTLDWFFLLSLRNCAVDDEGRTVFMKLVLNGYSTALAEEYSRRMSLVPIKDLIDKQGNNVLHLAVMSQSADVVARVLSILGTGPLLKMMQAQNNAGQTALDISVQQGNREIFELLKQDYRHQEALEYGGDVDALIKQLDQTEATSLITSHTAM